MSEIKSANERAVELFWIASGKSMTFDEYKEILTLRMSKPLRDMIAAAAVVIETDRRELLAWDRDQGAK